MKMYSSPSLRYDSSHQEFSLRGSDDDNFRISLEAERSYSNPTSGTTKLLVSDTDVFLPKWK